LTLVGTGNSARISGTARSEEKGSVLAERQQVYSRPAAGGWLPGKCKEDIRPFPQY
jgi:hypothetical protein